METEPRYTQIFNRYLEKGGEEAFVDQVEARLGAGGRLATLRFQSSDWVGRNAPGRLRQALLMWHNPESLRRLRDHEQAGASTAWILHNLFPVGSAALYLEAERRRMPTVCFTHNFRPFSVSGYLWARGGVEPAGLRGNFLPEILDGAWRGSRIQTAWYAMLLGWLHARGSFRRITHWIAVSEFMRERFVAAGIPPAKISTLRHPWFGAPPSHEASRTGEGYLYLGRLVEMKGIRFLVEAWRELARHLGAQTPLLHICGDGPDWGWVRERASENPFLALHGHVDGEQKNRLLQTTRALIVPSLCWEALGLVVYEAYAHGRPVLACRSGGLAEVLLDGRTGLLSEPGDTGQLVRNVLALENNPVEASRMGAHGREWLRTHADADDWERKLLALLSTVARRN